MICIEGRLAPLCDRVGVVYNCKTLSVASSLVPLLGYTIYKFTWKTKLNDDVDIEFIWQNYRSVNAAASPVRPDVAAEVYVGNTQLINLNTMSLV